MKLIFSDITTEEFSSNDTPRRDCVVFAPGVHAWSGLSGKAIIDLGKRNLRGGMSVTTKWG